MKDFELICQRLRGKGIDVALTSIHKHLYQGFMSQVYAASSNRGNLIIQIVHPLAEQERLKVWDKFTGIWNLVKDVPEIPAAEIFLAERISNDYALVQRMLPGTRAGERVIEDDRIYDRWDAPLDQYAPHIEIILAHVHRIPMDGYGWLEPNGITVKGMYKTWQEFLLKEYSRWSEGIIKAETALGSPTEELPHKLEAFGAALPKYTYEGPASLIHGDLIRRITWKNSGCPIQHIASNDRGTGKKNCISPRSMPWASPNHWTKTSGALSGRRD